VVSEPKKSRIADDALGRAQRQWQATLGELQLQMTRATFDTWLRGSRVIDLVQNTFIVYVQHAYAVDWLQNRLLPIIRRTLQRHAGSEADVEFTDRLPDSGEDLTLIPEPLPADQITPRPRGNGANGRPSTVLNPYYTFDTFVVGAGNRLAHAASLAVTENLAHAYNPLFIYGGVGLGKTHLLHALGHTTQQQGWSVLYVSAEWFTNDLINAIRNQQTEEFRSKYRHNDLLLVDDIQFIVGKERTQEEFFHTFNTLHGAGKQIVVSCDRPPKALVALEDRLRSRFGWGLIADVQAPDFETRIAILRAKAEGRAAQVPDEILAYIARKIPSNIRDLEGALNRVILLANLTHVPLTLEAARAALDGILSHSPTLTPERIISAVAQHYDLSKEQLVGRSRARAVSGPRQLAMFLIREETDSSLPEIGKLLGGRDHSTILHGCHKIGTQIEINEQLRRDWLTIKQVLSEGKVNT
jgi:chromosomal replication initiator protein